MHAVTKQWLTPKRIARGPEKANEELRRWAMTAFKPAKLVGTHPRELLEKRRRETGAYYMTKREHAPIGALAAGAAALIGGFFLGRWWVRRPVTAVRGTYLHGTYLNGTDILGAI